MVICQICELDRLSHSLVEAAISRNTWREAESRSQTLTYVPCHMELYRMACNWKRTQQTPSKMRVWQIGQFLGMPAISRNTWRSREADVDMCHLSYGIVHWNLSVSYMKSCPKLRTRALSGCICRNTQRNRFQTMKNFTCHCCPESPGTKTEAKFIWLSAETGPL